MAHDPNLPFQRRLLPPDLGAVLRGAREHAGLTRREVAAATSMAPRTLARIERGAQAPTWPTLERLCEALGLSTFAVARRWAKDAMDLPDHAGAAPGLAVAVLRRERGLTLEELAEMAGVSVATLSRFERGLTASRLLTGGSEPGRASSVDRGTPAGLRLSGALGFADLTSLVQECVGRQVAVDGSRKKPPAD